MLHTSVPSSPIINGSVPALLNYPVAFNTALVAAGILLCTIRATPDHPVLLEFFAEVGTVFNAASTNVLTLGTDAASANQILASGDIDESTVGFYPASNAIKKLRIIADTPIYMKYVQTGTAASAGAGLFYIKVTPLFPTPSSILGIQP